MRHDQESSRITSAATFVKGFPKKKRKEKQNRRNVTFDESERRLTTALAGYTAVYTVVQHTHAVQLFTFLFVYLFITFTSYACMYIVNSANVCKSRWCDMHPCRISFQTKQTTFFQWAVCPSAAFKPGPGPLNFVLVEHFHNCILWLCSIRLHRLSMRLRASHARV